MAKGYEIHQRRLMALQALGKDLARRAKSKCELTGASGVPLHAYEVPPTGDSPDLDRTLLVCDAVWQALEKPEIMKGRSPWQILSSAVWSDQPAVQVVAWRLLSEIAKRESWAAEALEELYLDPEIEAWAKDSR